MFKQNNLTNKKFGKLTAINVCKKSKSGFYWTCRCDCGNYKDIRGGHLTSGNTISCGCERKKIVDLTDKKFNRLTVIKYHDKIGNFHAWNCKCDCGKEVIVNGISLTTNNTKSCGCLLSEVTIKRSTKHGLRKRGKYNPDYEKMRRQDPCYKLRKNCSYQVWQAIKQNKKGSVITYLPYSINELKLHLENLWEPWMNWDNYGGKSNDKRQTWHIDHIIPKISFPYTSMDDPLFLSCWALSNLRPLEKISNIKKGTYGRK